MWPMVGGFVAGVVITSIIMYFLSRHFAKVDKRLRDKWEARWQTGIIEDENEYYAN